MRKCFGFLLALCLSTTAVSAQTLTEEQVKQLALEAILENPSIIMEAVAILEQRQRDEQALAAQAVMGQLSDTTNASVLGNPDGDITIVEFFDYNCGFCRRAGPVVEQIIADNPDVRVIMREWPILGEASVVASRASLAARNQDKYEEFHWAMMKGQGRASEATILKAARDLGMDVDQLQADMNSDAVNNHIQTSVNMAQAMGFTGTPAFVVGDQSAPGFISLEEMQGLVEAAREG
ncbi:MAG: DsbA family protein [Planktomarina sp.]